MHPSDACIHRMQISCAESFRCGCKCGFVARSKLPAITATAIQLSYLKLDSCKRTRVNNWNNCDLWLFSKKVKKTIDLYQLLYMYCYLLFKKTTVVVDRNKNFKYPTDLRCWKKCWIPSDSESVTSLFITTLLTTKIFQTDYIVCI